MNIKINNKKHQIKPASELTVSEYIELFERLEKGHSAIGVLINYLAITLDMQYDNIADINMDEHTIRRLMAFIGEIIPAKDMRTSDEFYYKKTGKRFYQKKINWRSVGVRRLLEERKEENQLKLSVYLLAVYISGNYDVEKVEEIYNELQSYRAIDVFSFVIFFFKGLQNGKKSGKNYLQKWLKKLKTKTPK